MKRIFILLLTLCSWVYLEASQSDLAYIKAQADVELNVAAKIHGFQPINMSDALVQRILSSCPNEVNMAIARIQKNIFREKEKNLIFYGPPGTGKVSTAFAIAKKCQLPCLLFNIRSMLTDRNSIIENLNRMLYCVSHLDSPCMIIFDELECLIKKDLQSNNMDDNFLITFWQELDKFTKNNIIFVGAINSLEDLPLQISLNATTIKTSLPPKEQHPNIFNFHMGELQKKYNFSVYPSYNEDIANRSLFILQNTKRFSYENFLTLATRATAPALSGVSKMVTKEHIHAAINPMHHNIKNNMNKIKVIKAQKYMPLVHSAITLGIHLALLKNSNIIANNSTIGARNSSIVAANSIEQLKYTIKNHFMMAKQYVTQNLYAQKNFKLGQANHYMSFGAIVLGGAGGVLGGIAGGIAGTAAGPAGIAAGAMAGSTKGAAIGSTVGACLGKTISHFQS